MVIISKKVIKYLIRENFRQEPKYILLKWFFLSIRTPLIAPNNKNIYWAKKLSIDFTRHYYCKYKLLYNTRGFCFKSIVKLYSLLNTYSFSVALIVSYNDKIDFEIIFCEYKNTFHLCINYKLYTLTVLKSLYNKNYTPINLYIIMLC